MLARFRATHHTSIALTAALAACALDEIGLAPFENDPIAVQAVLNAGSPRQVVWIERGFAPGRRLDYPQGPGSLALPVPPSRVEVREVGGPVHVFQPDPADAARFLADFTPAPGGRYELLIEASDRTIRGAVVVPDPVVIVEPAADTVDLPVEELRLAWRPVSTPEFGWLATPPDGTTDPYGFFPAPTWVRADTATVVSRSSVFWYRPETVVWVLATDGATARLHDFTRRVSERERLVGNLDGAIGVFGAMTWDRVVVRVPQ
jgi:hypothetical protein